MPADRPPPPALVRPPLASPERLRDPAGSPAILGDGALADHLEDRSTQGQSDRRPSHLSPSWLGLEATILRRRWMRASASRRGDPGPDHDR
jgi:hypothetical protein